MTPEGTVTLEEKIPSRTSDCFVCKKSNYQFICFAKNVVPIGELVSALVASFAGRGFESSWGR